MLTKKVMDKPKCAQKAPYVLEVEPGKYAWCTCGESTNQPFCNGAHKGTSFTPNIEVVENKKIIAWCGCKQSKNGSFCDGNHRNL